MVLNLEPRQAGALAIAINDFRQRHSDLDQRLINSLAELQHELTKAANGGHRASAFDPGELAGQARSMKPLAVTYEAAGELLACSASTIQRLVRSRELATVGEGRGARVVTASVEAYVARAISSLEPAS